MSLAARCFDGLRTLVGRGGGLEFTAGLLRVLTRIVPLRRAEARRAIGFSFPELERQELDRLLDGVYDHFCRMVAEWALCVNCPERIDELVWADEETKAVLDRYRDRGVVLLTAHLGNWELLGGWLSRQGYPLTALARDAEDKDFTAVVNRWRAALGFDVLRKAEGPTAGRNLARTVKEGRWLVLLADQDGGPTGRPVTFLGRRASMVSGPAALASLSGAPILPLFIHREQGRHRVVAGPAYELPSGPREEVRAQATEWCNRQIEAAVRAHPDEWFWFHRRWKWGDRV